MNTLKIVGTAFFLLLGLMSNAQIRYGFKTGLNFARIEGPSELDNSGNALESWKSIVGFHIGMTFGYKINDRFGVRGELLYSKMGGEYKFEGPAYRIFTYDGGSIFTTGKSKVQINISNAYLTLPVMAYGRFGDLEVSGGAFVGLNVASSGEGALAYTDGVSENNLTFENSDYFLNYNYRKDKPGEAGGDETFTLRVDNRNLELPKSLGAYYEYPEDKGHLFNSLDFGLVGGLSYYLTSSLYIGARLQYGLADVTNNDADLQKSKTGDNKSLIYRNDKDKNIAIQASVGFSF